MVFFFNDTATTEIYTLSLHDALPIWHADVLRSVRRWQSPDRAARRLHEHPVHGRDHPQARPNPQGLCARAAGTRDRKSTRLNSSHANISYAVFCLKKKKILLQRTLVA